MSSRMMLFLTIPVLSTSFLLFAVGAVAAWYVHQVNRDVSHLLADNLECAVACERLVGYARNASAELDRFVDTGNRSHLDMAVAARNHVIQSFDHAERLASNRQVRDMLIRTRQKYNRFFADLEVVRAKGTEDTSTAAVRGMSRRLGTEVLRPAQEILTYNQRALVQHSDRSRDVADRVGLGFFALGTCGAAAGLLSGFGVSRNVNQRLNQRELEALHAEQLAAIGQLATGLAHELRNPLMSMKLLIQAAEENRVEASLAGRDLTVLQEEVARLEQLVNSFLDFARPPKMEKTVFDVRCLVDQTIHLISGPATQRNVVIDYQPVLHPLNIEADPVQIRQVLLNLLLNALDVLPNGGTIQVVAELLSTGPSGWLTMRVIDSGPGIPVDMRDRIFEPFVSTKETGTGLGLAISRRIVEAHDGTIEEANGNGGGAEFTIRLPIQMDARPVLVVNEDLLESEAS